MENEIWKNIEGYEGLYQVSNLGRVRSLNYKNTGRKKILSAGKTKGGYLHVVLCKNGKLSCKYIHRLVAEAFIPNPNNLPEINHKSEDKTLNTVKSLEWCDRVYNINYGSGIKRGAQNRQKPIKQMTLDGILITIWPSAREAKKNGYSYNSIVNCCLGRQQTHQGYKWKYL
jgi:hypothetical protein